MIKIKFPFGTYLKRYFYFFLIALFLPPLLVNYLMQLRLNPTAEETLSALVVADMKGSTSEEIYKNKEEVGNLLFSNIDSKIVARNLYVLSKTDSSFSDTFNFRLKTSDILVYQENYLTGDVSKYLELPTIYQNESDYKYNNIHYGIDVTDKMSKYFDYYGKKTYLFVLNTSCHIDNVNDYAFQLLRNYIA